jgi:hypothetical protein
MRSSTALTEPCHLHWAAHACLVVTGVVEDHLRLPCNVEHCCCSDGWVSAHPGLGACSQDSDDATHMQPLTNNSQCRADFARVGWWDANDRAPSRMPSVPSSTRFATSVASARVGRGASTMVSTCHVVDGGLSQGVSHRWSHVTYQLPYTARRCREKPCSGGGRTTRATITGLPAKLHAESTCTQWPTPLSKQRHAVKSQRCTDTAHALTAHHLLGQKHLLGRQVDAQVAAGEDDAVGSLNDLLKRHQPLPVLDLGNHLRSAESKPAADNVELFPLSALAHGVKGNRRPVLVTDNMQLELATQQKSMRTWSSADGWRASHQHSDRTTRSHSPPAEVAHARRATHLWGFTGV